MTPLLAILVLAASPSVVELRTERVDLVEVNHYFDLDGSHVLDQLIAYDWCEATGRYQVRDWRVIKSGRQFPQPTDDGFAATWSEGRVVKAAHFRETWTQHDPELTERRNLPQDARRKLFAPASP